MTKIKDIPKVENNYKRVKLKLVKAKNI